MNTDINKNDNITFFLFEENENNNNENNNDDKIKQIMDNFSNLDVSDLNKNDENINENINDKYFNLWDYGMNCEEGYENDIQEKEYTVKDLLKICSYYGIDKNIKISKCKKQDIIANLVYFESLPENFYIVQKRNRMWKYMNELLNDPKMKRFIIWD